MSIEIESAETNRKLIKGEPIDGDTAAPLTFVAEIQQIMHSLGDCNRPLLSSATLIEQILHQQMTSLLIQAKEVSELRQSESISLEDLLFLLRKDKQKLNRILRYLEFKETRLKVSQGVVGDFAEEGTSKKTAGLYKQCCDFLLSLDNTGEFLSLINNPPVDEAKRDRQLRAEYITRNMTSKEYSDYSQARRVSFSQRCRGGAMNKFNDWLFEGAPPEEQNIATVVLELLHYFAYETVAEIIDLALLVKQGSIPKHDTIALEPTKPPPQLYQSGVQLLQKGVKRRLSGDKPEPEFEIPDSKRILPSDIMAVINRYYDPGYAFTEFSRTVDNGRKLFAL